MMNKIIFDVRKIVKEITNLTEVDIDNKTVGDI